MAQYIPLSPEQHGDLKISTDKSYDAFESHNIIPVLIHETPHLACEYPIVFVKNEQTGDFICVAMTGIKGKNNLFVKDGKWQSPFIPSIVAIEPFMLAKDEQNPDSKFVCVDEKSTNISQNEGIELFNDDQTQTDYLNKVIDRLQQNDARKAQTDDFVQLLKDLELLEPQTVKINIPNQRPETISGFFTINEKQLNEIDDKTFIDLKEKGYLAAIYSHLVSLNQVTRLGQRYSDQSDL